MEAPIPGIAEAQISANGTKPETPQDSVPVFSCSTCGDTGEVRILFQSTTGLMPGRKGIACPDCKAGAVNIGTAGDAQIRDLQTAVRLLKIAAIVLALGLVLAAALPIIKNPDLVKVDLKSAGGVKSE